MPVRTQRSSAFSRREWKQIGIPRSGNCPRCHWIQYCSVEAITTFFLPSATDVLFLDRFETEGVTFGSDGPTDIARVAQETDSIFAGDNTFEGRDRQFSVKDGVEEPTLDPIAVGNPRRESKEKKKPTFWFPSTILPGLLELVPTSSMSLLLFQSKLA